MSELHEISVGRARQDVPAPPSPRGAGEAAGTHPGPDPARPRSRSRAGRLGLLGLVVVAEAVWLTTRAELSGGARWVPPAVAVAAHLGLVVWEHRRPVLGAGPVLAATAAVALVAVVVPPFGSGDVYLYASYGRLVTDAHLNPYLADLGALRGDALPGLVDESYRQAPTAYGPVFTAWSAAGAVLYGDSPLRARLFFQATAAAALLGGTAYLHRRARSQATLIAVGLSPVLVAAANGGHLDLLAGLAALVGVDLVTRRRTTAGAALVGLAIAVKMLLLPVAGVVVLAAVIARRWGEAARATATIGAVLVGTYAIAGGPAALAPLREINQVVSRGSFWGALSRDDGANQLLRGDGWAQPLALVVVVVGLALLAWRAPRPIDVVMVATAAGVLVCFGANYTLPWYASGYLLLAALAPSLPARALVAGATVQLAVYVQPPGQLMGDLIGSINLAVIGGVVLGGLLATTMAWVVISGRRRSGPLRPQVSGSDPIGSTRPHHPGDVISRDC